MTLEDHLPNVTPRGFRYAEIPYQDYGSDQNILSIQESSLATERKLWVGPHDNRMHLSEGVVRQLRDALTAWLGDEENKES